jgi:uncharacterized protein (DUF433 family)
MTTITLRDAVANLEELIRRLSPGEEVIITENDQPVAKLVAALPSSRRIPKLGSQPGSVISMDHFDDPLEDFREYTESISQLDRVTFDPNVMGGKPCIRGMRVTVGTIVGLIASGATKEAILADYPYLEADDIKAALSYAAWCSEKIDVPPDRP